jgi:hypothetical protein
MLYSISPFAFVHTPVHTHTHTHTHTHPRTYTRAHAGVHRRNCYAISRRQGAAPERGHFDAHATCVNLCACGYVYVCACVHLSVIVQYFTYTHTHTHARTHTYYTYVYLIYITYTRIIHNVQVIETIINRKHTSVVSPKGNTVQFKSTTSLGSEHFGSTTSVGTKTDREGWTGVGCQLERRHSSGMKTRARMYISMCVVMFTVCLCGNVYVWVYECSDRWGRILGVCIRGCLLQRSLCACKRMCMHERRETGLHLKCLHL